MAEEKAPEHSIAPPEATVTITVLPPARGRSLRDLPGALERMHRTRCILGALIALAVLGAVTVTELQSRRTSPGAQARRARARAAIAAAFGYPYPIQCLTITIPASNPGYARADVKRTHECRRYHGYLNASFQLVGGRWRLVRDEGQLFVANSLLTPSRQSAAVIDPRRASTSVGSDANPPARSATRRKPARRSRLAAIAER
jgi:hypothetical protein